MDTADFVDLLLRTVPEAGDLHRQHLEDNLGEVLLHLLVADVRRLTLRAFETVDRGLLRRCLEVMDASLREGDVPLRNAVAVSFVEARDGGILTCSRSLQRGPPLCVPRPRGGLATQGDNARLRISGRDRAEP